MPLLLLYLPPISTHLSQFCCVMAVSSSLIASCQIPGVYKQKKNQQQMSTHAESGLNYREYSTIVI